MKIGYSLINAIIPSYIRKKINARNNRQELIHFYDSHFHELTKDKLEALSYIRKNGLCLFPYSFQENYKQADITVHIDKESGLKYVIFDGKRLYFRRKSSIRSIKHQFNNLRREQDIHSPHRYLTTNFQIEFNDILVDVGAAEGNLTLSVIEKVRKAYIFEVDEEWNEALKATFSPWKDKVEIINKFVSNKNDDKNLTLDTFFENNDPFSFLKVDAEGADEEVLSGCTNILANQGNLKLVVCTYHKPDDDLRFSELLMSKGLDISQSDGYMIFGSPPRMRKGVIRASKSKNFGGLI